MEPILRGTAVSSGVAHGTAYVITRADGAVVPSRTLDEAEVEAELNRFDLALARAESDLTALSKSVGERIGIGEADIFGAQALLVRDHGLHDQVVALVRQKRVNAEAALSEVIEKLVRAFDGIPDVRLRERSADIRDVGNRIFEALTADDGCVLCQVPEGSILIADELLPSATAGVELNRVRALVTDRGGKFSHTSILARSMRMPAVTGISEAVLKIKTGDHVIVDAVAGTVWINPDAPTRRDYDRVETELRDYRTQLAGTVDLAAVTLDGMPIRLMANVSKLADAEAAFLYKADGIGLLRTEFGYSSRRAFPTEDEQYQALQRAAQKLHPRRVVLRLLDIGGDKELPYFPRPTTRNPSLALRGIRLLLKHPDILKRQLRAFLRLSAEHPVAILIPVVGGLEEVRATRALMEECMEELRAEGRPFNPKVELGAMIEVPSAALMTHTLAKEVDFFSLGTNDLVQYVLAADREVETVAEYYQPLHPAVLRLIHWVAEAAAKADRPLTICGEMAGDPRFSPLLLGLGLRELSVAPGEILEVKGAIRRMNLQDARDLARSALDAGSVAEVEALLSSRAPSLSSTGT